MHVAINPPIATHISALRRVVQGEGVDVSWMRRRMLLLKFLSIIYSHTYIKGRQDDSWAKHKSRPESLTSFPADRRTRHGMPKTKNQQNILLVIGKSTTTPLTATQATSRPTNQPCKTESAPLSSPHHALHHIYNTRPATEDSLLSLVCTFLRPLPA